MVLILMLDMFNFMIYCFAAIPIASETIQTAAMDKFGSFFNAYNDEESDLESVSAGSLRNLNVTFKLGFEDQNKNKKDFDPNEK